MFQFQHSLISCCRFSDHKSLNLLLSILIYFHIVPLTFYVHIILVVTFNEELFHFYVNLTLSSNDYMTNIFETKGIYFSDNLQVDEIHQWILFLIPTLLSSLHFTQTGWKYVVPYLNSIQFVLMSRFQTVFSL